jgi:putative addiction module component (TIGR02574 family)
MLVKAQRWRSVKVCARVSAVITDSRHVLSEALKLPLQERAQLVADLITSLDGEPDSEVEAAWAAELESRARKVLAGEGKFEDWDVVRERLRPST